MMLPLFSVLIVGFSLALFIPWSRQLGTRKALLALGLRFCWLGPLLSLAWPQKIQITRPGSVDLEPVHVLWDDSASMYVKADSQGELLSKRAQSLLSTLRSLCLEKACTIKSSPLSQWSGEERGAYTHLTEGLESFLSSTKDEPWVLISDGGDIYPTLPLSPGLKNQGKSTPTKTRGLIYPLGSGAQENFWLEMSEEPIFAFQDKRLSTKLRVKRESLKKEARGTQVQVQLQGKVLVSEPVHFAPDENEIEVELHYGPLGKGMHHLNFRVLPAPQEKEIWDNELYRLAEVLPNTTGVLHLLGSPSWDGRFLRRYLKSEPKFDLISFHILRDPRDKQNVDERELSLIPFPIDRLFKEELPHFRILIMQNFNLSFFLEPEYQAQVAKFVKEGGGLLFIGGPRAMSRIDLNNSPLREILPFELKDNPFQPTSNGRFNFELDESDGQFGPWYDPKLAFKIKMAEASSEAIAKAPLYEEWAQLWPELSFTGPFKGIHHMERVALLAKLSTPLLTAETSDGTKIPLALASYPGRGRALWIFSDELWKMAIDPPPQSSRLLYGEFIGRGLRWLAREEWERPLEWGNLILKTQAEGPWHFQFELSGQALKNVRKLQDINLEVCGEALSDFELQRLSDQALRIKGSIKPSNKSYCQAQVSLDGGGFGALSIKAPILKAKAFSDTELPSSELKLAQIAEWTGAEKAELEQGEEAVLAKFLNGQLKTHGLSQKADQEWKTEPYWLLQNPWMWLLLSALVLEIALRQWHRTSTAQRP